VGAGIVGYRIGELDRQRTGKGEDLTGFGAGYLSNKLRLPVTNDGLCLVHHSKWRRCLGTGRVNRAKGFGVAGTIGRGAGGTEYNRADQQEADSQQTDSL
jgi:hypothetical protein